jgi:hypothetical protein
MPETGRRDNILQVLRALPHATRPAHRGVGPLRICLACRVSGRSGEVRRSASTARVCLACRRCNLLAQVGVRESTSRACASESAEDSAADPAYAHAHTHACRAAGHPSDSAADAADGGPARASEERPDETRIKRGLLGLLVGVVDVLGHLLGVVRIRVRRLEGIRQVVGEVIDVVVALGDCPLYERVRVYLRLFEKTIHSDS